jgi:inner membrane protein involved in colicin E2 resistance
MVLKNLKNVFQHSIDEVVKSRNKKEVIEAHEVQPTTLSNQVFNDDRTETTDSESDEVLDVSLLEPIDNKEQHNVVEDYKALYESLVFKHNVIVEQLKKENDRLWEVVMKFASK